jgi:hypothetical protein
VQRTAPGYEAAVLIALIVVGIIAVLLVILAVVPFGASGVTYAKENARWSGANASPRLRYDPERRFEPPAGGG